MRELSRLDKIVVLLETYKDAEETLQRGDGGGRFDPGPRRLSMPSVWKTGGYRELERTLARMKTLEPDLFWHVRERYLRRVRRTETIKRKEGRSLMLRTVVEIDRSPAGVRRFVRETWIELDPNERVATATEGEGPKIVERWHENVRPALVGRGLDWISRNYRGDPRIPLCARCEKMMTTCACNDGEKLAA
jgi:hypothetical protein